MAERGTPVGADEMIERVEAHMADDPLVVVKTQRRGNVPTAGSEIKRPASLRSAGRGLAWAFAGAITIVVVAWMSALSGGVEGEVRNPVTTTISGLIDTAGMSDHELVEAGIRAWEEGDAAAVAQLFDFGFRSRWSLDELNGELAYQARVPDMVTVECGMSGADVVCETLNTTPMTDTVGVDVSAESIRFRVEDSTIVPLAGGFPLPAWSPGHVSMAVYLRLHGRIIYAEPWDTQLKEYTLECLEAPREEFCASLEAKNLEGWATWYPGIPNEMIDAHVTAWFGGDCERAFLLLGDFEPLPDINCPYPAIHYETEMEARAEVTECEEQLAGDRVIVTCEILYSNLMSEAVDKEPVAITKSYEVGTSLEELDDHYPSDSELMSSFGQYVDQQDMTSEYDRACRTRQPSCANFILTRLDDWAAWHLANS